MMLALLIAALLLMPTAAVAGPLIAAVIIGEAITATMILTTVATLAISFGLSYVAGKLLEKPSDIPIRTPVGGTEIDLRVDANIPRAILFGECCTAGSLAHGDTYGRQDRTANSDLIEFIALADHPCDSLVDIFVNGKNEGYTPNLAGDPGGVIEGMRVLDYKRKLFFKFYDGTQTAADDLAIQELTGPKGWTADHIGQGVCYVRVHAIYYQTLVTSAPEWRFVVRGIKLYDPRKDTTAGGSGTHRFDQLDTHEWTDNPMVIAYNILRGIYVEDGLGNRDHFYGLKRANADHLPFDDWVAAMNACDEDITTSDTTNRYRCGGEVSVDTEPYEVIKELLKCCGGRLTELGGVYKPYIDVPELPVAAFTDDDILDTEDTFSPVLPLEQRVNYITGRYTTRFLWSEKDAPPRENSTFETEDGRRLPADLSVPMVQTSKQCQLLMKQLLLRSRRMRKHIVSLPPRYFNVEAGQVVSWESVRNGYEDKLFEIDAVEYHSNLAVTLSLTEIDPDDYDWDEIDVIDEDDEEITPQIPPPKTVAGFAVTAVTVTGDEGTKRPAIKLVWTPPEDGDIQRIVYQIRRPSEALNVFTGDHNEVEDGQVVTSNVLQPVTAYEVRARYDSRSAYEADWSSWKPVTTTNARIGVNDFEEAVQFEISEGIAQKVGELETSLSLLNGVVSELEAGVDLDITRLDNRITNVNANIRAAYTEAIAVATGPDSALAQAITSLESEVDGMRAAVKAQFVTAVKPDFALAAYELALTAFEASAGMTLIARSIAGERVSQVWFNARDFLIGQKGDDGSFKSPFVITQVGGKAKVFIDGTLLADSIKAATAFIGSLSAVSANLGTITAGTILFSGTTGQIKITSNPPQILVSEAI